ncbi:dienelactone hydrolase family [Fusarium sporotrichioides]|uniref:Dienelactone hydrolase family n=1 Tax=Fusarium sporotrichioides TaxID=5514 RepID=A0A395RUY4_FUSSP|nr:dienelactone hydrolase family [Fusarium sporotrichioides]
MPCDDCKTGFQWNGTPIGKEATLNDAAAYVTGNSTDTAILVLTDFFKPTLTLPNIRILADHYAKEAHATVYVPDMRYLSLIKAKDFNMGAFLGRNTKDIRWPEIKAAAQTLKSQYSKVAAIGFCYGGWAAFKLAADPSLIDVVSVAHPSGLERHEIEGVKVPVQILAPENDHEYSKQLKVYTLEKLPKTSV